MDSMKNNEMKNSISINNLTSNSSENKLKLLKDTYLINQNYYINNNIKINLKKEDTPENFLKNENEGQIKNFNKYIKNIPKNASKDCSISYNTTRSVNKMSKNELSKSGNSCNKIGISIKVHSPPKSKVNRS